MILPVSFNKAPLIFKGTAVNNKPSDDNFKKSSKEDAALKNVQRFVSEYKLSIWQIPKLLKLPPEQIRAFKEAVRQLRCEEIYYCAIDKVQHKSGYQIQAFTNAFNDRDFSSNIDFDIKVTPECDVIITRNETDSENNVSTRVKNSDTETVLKYKRDKFDYLSEIYEIKPDCIIHSRLSDKLQGFFEVTKYDFANYSEDTDLLQAIEKNEIEGEPVSKIIKNGKYSEFSEQFEYRGINTQRSYKESSDKNFRQLEYKIWTKDEELLNYKKTWIKVSENETITKVNNKTYRAKFNGYSCVEITDDEGNTTIIDLKSKFYNFGRSFIETLDAQTLLNINEYVKQVKAEYFGCKRYNSIDNIIYVNDTHYGLQHELGHAIDNKIKQSDKQKRLEFLKAYHEELEAFRHMSSSTIYKNFEYFSEISTSLGSDELLAEVNLLMNNASDVTKKLSAREYFLVHYFPKTIACAAKLLNVCC